MSSPAIRITVTAHAIWRAYERFPGFDPYDIDAEIRAAFRAGRVSPRKPQGVLNDDDPGCLYAWTPDGYRVYVITPHTSGKSLAVKTTIKTTLAPGWEKGKRLPDVEKVTHTPGYWGK